MAEACERRMDPAAVLPTEIFQLLVIKLSKNEKLRLRLVSKPWANRIQAASVLWNTLSWGVVPSPLGQISERGVEVLLNLARNQDGKVDLSKLSIGGSNEKVNVISDLIFSRIDNLRSLTLRSHRDGVHIVEYLEPLQNLTFLAIWYDSTDRWKDQANVAEILDTFRHLKKAEFFGFKWSDCRKFTWPQGLTNLEALSMGTLTCPGQKISTVICGLPFDHHRLASLATGAPNLKTLRLSYTCAPEPGQKIHDLDFTGFKNLEDLAVEHVVATLAPKLLPSSLQRLRWGTRGMYRAHEKLEAAYHEIPCLPKLRALQVGSCPAGQFWFDLIRKSGSTLRSLSLWKIGYRPSHDEQQVAAPEKDWERRLLVDLLRGNYLAGLQWLSIRSHAVDDLLAEEIATHCPSLNCLVININHGFSHQAAASLFRKSGQPLQHLVLGSLYYPPSNRSNSQSLIEKLRRDIDFPLRVSCECDLGGSWASTGWKPDK